MSRTRNSIRTRGFAALILVLAAAACTPAATTSPGATGVTPATSGATPGAPAASADAQATVLVRDFELDPSTVTITGGTVALAVTNQGPTIHNVTVRDASGTVLFGTADLKEGQSETVTHALAPGTYVLFCSLPGHESLGVKGTLTVIAP